MCLRYTVITFDRLCNCALTGWEALTVEAAGCAGGLLEGLDTQSYRCVFSGLSQNRVGAKLCVPGSSDNFRSS